MDPGDDEEERLRAVALQTAQSIHAARRRAEEELRKQTEWLRVTLASIGDGVISTDAEGRVTFMNGVAEQLTGWPQAEAIRRSLPDVFRIVNESTRQPIENPALRALREGAIVGLANHTVLVARDGSERPIDDSAAPMRDQHGPAMGAVLVFRDVTEQKRAEEERRRLDERRRLALDAAQLGSWNMDLATEELEIDERFREIFCVSRERLSCQAVLSLIHPEDRDRVREAGAAATRPEHPQPYSVNYRIIHPDGSVHWVAAKGRCTLISEGNGQYRTSFDGTVADITERKRVEEELRAKDERLNLFIENIKDYAVIIEDPDGTVIEWQGGAERITGYSPEEAMGQKCDLIFTLEDQAAGILELEIKKAAQTGRADDKRWYRKKDGSLFFADGVVAALKDEGGKLRGFGKVFKDATGEWQAEQATLRRAAQLQSLADISARINAAHDIHSVIGVVTEEARSLIGARQAATCMALSPQDPEPINVLSTASDRSAERVWTGPSGVRIYQAVLAENRSVRLRQDELAVDPRWQTLEPVALAIPSSNGWLAAPLIGRNGKSLGLLQLADKDEGEFTAEDEAILVQLSRLAAIAIENAKLYEELRGNDQRKDEFLAMLAHELRNPLSAIGNAVNLATRTGNQEHVGWSMEVIARQMKHLTRLIDDLLDVSRISRGKIELRKDLLDATPILDSALATVKPLADERQHTLEVSIDRGSLWVNVDPTRLEQVVINLLNNAAKYSENTGHIHLSAHTEGESVIISVRDRGVGIRPEKLPGMFELFAQGDRTLARSEGGLGIGLTVVKKLVELHGGSVTAVSDGLGKGSKFTIRLPAATRPTAEAADTALKLETLSKTLRILVVDDNVDMARGMAKLLRVIGHEVATAQGGHEALAVARHVHARGYPARHWPPWHGWLRGRRQGSARSVL